MVHVQTCSGPNRIIPLMQRPNTDSAPNMPVTLPRNQLLIRYMDMSPVHTFTIRCYGTRQRYNYLPTFTSCIEINILHATYVSLHNTIPSKSSQFNANRLLTANPSKSNTLTVEWIWGTIRVIPSEILNNFADSSYILSVTWLYAGDFIIFL
jgi:alpha-N-acetylglucosamine transferase